jgi:hypothetical protein
MRALAEHTPTLAETHLWGFLSPPSLHLAIQGPKLKGKHSPARICANKYDDPIPIYCDNTSAINISKKMMMHSMMKHIPIKYHFLWEHVVEKNIRDEYVGTKEQVEDIFTKPLPREAFEYLC